MFLFLSPSGVRQSFVGVTICLTIVGVSIQEPFSPVEEPWKHSWWWMCVSFLLVHRWGLFFRIVRLKRLAASHREMIHKSKTEVSCESANKTGPPVVRLRSLTDYRIRLDLFVFWLSRIALIVWTEWSVVSILFNTLYFLVGVSLLTSVWFRTWRRIFPHRELYGGRVNTGVPVACVHGVHIPMLLVYSE